MGDFTTKKTLSTLCSTNSSSFHQKYKKDYFNSGYEDLNERNTGKDRLCFKRNDILIATLERFDRL